MNVPNRGVKVSKSLYFLKKTKKPAIILEVCFCDDEDDFIAVPKDERFDLIRSHKHG